MTGGGFGPCGTGAGRGGRPGRQALYGAGWATAGRGLRRWLDFGFFRSGRGAGPMTAGEEKDSLKAQAEGLKAELAGLEKRLADLEK